ncbi:MAG: transporter [Pseudomonas sp.]|uniref:MFS transporter n=1 Tax=Pseudomonas sp. TaxID=306 RepID=UPI0026086E77|nr:MFS transporter [Pseudomonas sp.]MDB6048711.1 transporter [Pseudomonas sp.]
MENNPDLVRIRKIQRLTMVMLVISVTVSTIDRAALSVANPLIRAEFGLSLADMGYLLSAFLWAYALAQLPIGTLIDRFGPRWVLSIGLAVWSTAQMLCGLVTGPVQLFAARALLGAGEAPQFPSGARVVRDWFSVKERGTATGVFLSASYLGTGLAAPLLTFLMLSFGWRWMFLVMGVFGLIVAVVWKVFYREPSQIALTHAENVYRLDGNLTPVSNKVTFAQWRSLFRSATVWGLVTGYFGVIYVNWLFNTWLPGYLQMERHMTLEHVGWAVAVPYAFAVCGALFAGRLTDWLARRGVSLINSRRIPACCFLLVQFVLIVMVTFIPDNSLAIGCLSLAMFCGTAATTTAWAMISALCPANCTGSMGALQNLGGYTGGALAPVITGLIVQHTGSFTPALFTGAGMSLLSAIIYLVFVRAPVTVSDPESFGSGQHVKAA